MEKKNYKKGYKQAKDIFPPKEVPNFVPYEPVSEPKKDYVPVTTKPTEVYVGNAINGEPFKINMETEPHILIAGSTHNGKNRALDTIITNLIKSCTDEEVQLFIFNPTNIDFLFYEKFSQVRACCTSLESTHTELCKILEVLETRGTLRSKMLKDGHEGNLFEFGKIYKTGIQLSAYYLIIDEIQYFAVDKNVTDEEKSLKNKILNMIQRIAQYGSQLGIYLIIKGHRLTPDNISPFIKSMSSSKILLDNLNPNSAELSFTGDTAMNIHFPNFDLRTVFKKQQPIINRLETCIFQRKEHGEWEKGLLINEGEGHLLDRCGNPIEDVWNYRTTSDIVLSNLDMIFDKDKAMRFRTMESCRFEKVEREVVSDIKTAEKYIEHEVEQVNTNSKIGYTL